MERNRVNELVRNNRTNEEAIVVKDLTKYFRSVLVVNRLSFAVHKNECFGLLGANGAGKTTTFSMLATDLLLDNGNAYVNNF